MLLDVANLLRLTVCALRCLSPTRYLGNVEVNDIQGDEVVRDAIHKLKDVIKAASSSRSSGRRSSTASKRTSSGGGDAAVSPTTTVEGESVVVNMPTLLIISSEGIRIIDETSRDVVANVIIKAVSYSTEVIGKKLELFAFIEVDDRRNTKTCHVFMCEKGVKDAALAICNAVCAAFEAAVAEAKARAGNPLLPMDKVRDVVEGPLAALQVPRKDLIAIKAIGAGQFGKVYLASGAPGFDKCAVKMLRFGASASDRMEFVREAETMVTIGAQPNIVRMIGVAVQQRPWLVILEYCLYGDLSDVVKALGRRKIALTAGEQLHVGEQLANGLAFIASKRYVALLLSAARHHIRSALPGWVSCVRPCGTRCIMLTSTVNITQVCPHGFCCAKRARDRGFCNEDRRLRAHTLI